MSHEEDLLFAAFALQLSLAPLPQTLEAAAAWAAITWRGGFDMD